VLIFLTCPSLADEMDIFEDVGLKLFVNGENPTPIEISAGGLMILKQDFLNFHEEADKTIVAHAIYATTMESKHGQVVADNTHTHTYNLLLNHYY
jgi:hypothetical protein